MFVFMTLHGTLIDTASSEMTNNLKTLWFKSLLRQDIAYYDITDISGTATIISTNGMKYKMGTGHKLGEGVQFFFTLSGGIIFALWSSWRVALVMVFSVIPLMTLSVFSLLRMNHTQSTRANASYSKAGSIVYTVRSCCCHTLDVDEARVVLMLSDFRI
jgi:ATP-binding cassette subfamily B (MDR/TAP) protein 1